MARRPRDPCRRPCPLPPLSVPWRPPPSRRAPSPTARPAGFRASGSEPAVPRWSRAEARPARLHSGRGWGGQAGPTVTHGGETRRIKLNRFIVDEVVGRARTMARVRVAAAAAASTGRRRGAALGSRCGTSAAIFHCWPLARGQLRLVRVLILDPHITAKRQFRRGPEAILCARPRLKYLDDRPADARPGLGLNGLVDAVVDLRSA